MPYQTIEVKGRQVALERRRYSNKTFTWAYLIPLDETTEWELLGDPWPCLNPPRRELEAEVERRLT